MADDLTARLAVLEERQAELERTIADLRVELDNRHGGFRSMRDTRRCPACRGQALLHVREASSTYGGEIIGLALAYDVSMWRGSRSRGPLEAFACRSCGLVEYHAVDVANVVADGAKIIAIEPEGEAPSEGPFR
ncbi:MAG: hypothetical protein AB7T06_15560 [Kofleriaceae bacterium]